jgi:hypothetical protein
VTMEAAAKVATVRTADTKCVRRAIIESRTVAF